MILKLLLNPALPRNLMCRHFNNSSFDTFLELIFPFECLKPFFYNLGMFLTQFYLFRTQSKILVNLRQVLFNNNLFHVPCRVMPVQHRRGKLFTDLLQSLHWIWFYAILRLIRLVFDTHNVWIRLVLGALSNLNSFDTHLILFF